MFRKTSPPLSMLESRFLVSAEKRKRLANSWAEVFRMKVRPSIDEEHMRAAFDDVMGRPNPSICLLTGAPILKEYNDLTDQEALDNLEFNLQW